MAATPVNIDPKAFAAWAKKYPEKAKQFAVLQRQRRTLEARRDINVFIEEVMTDETKGVYVKQAPYHREMQALIDSSDRVIIQAHIRSGKTQQMVGRILFTLGTVPNARIAIVANTGGQAVKIVKNVQTYIEKSERLHEIFPHVVPGEPWTDRRFSIARDNPAKDFSVEGAGVGGPFNGARLSHIFVDDILDHENTTSEALKANLQAWWDSTMYSRLIQNRRDGGGREIPHTGGKIVVIGTPWLPNDLMSTWGTSGRWTVAKYPVLKEDGTVQWPDQWTLDEVQRRVEELGPFDAQRQLFVNPWSSQDAVFKKAWVDTCLTLGQSKLPLTYLHAPPQGARVITGVDLAVGTQGKHDLTVFTTILVYKDGRREIIGIDSGRWAGPEILSKAQEVYTRYHGLFVVESNAAQRYMADFIGKNNIPVRTFTTTKQAKESPEWGIHGLAAEMAQGRWTIPSAPELGTNRMNPEVQKLVSGLLYYNPVDHPADHLMSLWMAYQGIKMTNTTAETGRLNIRDR